MAATMLGERAEMSSRASRMETMMEAAITASGHSDVLAVGRELRAGLTSGMD